MDVPDAIATTRRSEAEHNWPKRASKKNRVAIVDGGLTTGDEHDEKSVPDD